MSDYKTLRRHIRFHNVRKWLLKGAREEEAHTIMRAIEKLDEGDLQRRFARMLAKG